MGLKGRTLRPLGWWVTGDTLTQDETLCQIRVMAAPRTDLELDDVMAVAPFAERHRRTIDGPATEVWPHCLEVTAREVRALGPLVALRSIPGYLTSKPTVRVSDARPLLDVFAREGFVVLRRDEEPTDGRAVVLFGAAGRFWSPAGNAPVTFDDAEDFLAFDEPGYAKTVASLVATETGDGTTVVETVTRVVGTTPGATRAFRPYWALIRGPSGLIRRSWLAAIDRRVSA